MIHYSIIIKSNHWPRRLKKINKIIKLILKQKKLFNFNKNVIYYCNFILMNDSCIKKFNHLYKLIRIFLQNRGLLTTRIVSI